MSGVLKKLAGQTAIYGLSSIVARLFNFLLVPIYTRQFDPSEYGVVTELYSYVAFFIVLLTYGMETSFFRFSSKLEDKQKVYNNAITPITLTTSLFILLAIMFSQNIADVTKYSDHSEYIIWLALILGFDALSAIPLAKLRELNKAKFFAFVNLASIGLNIGLNLFFIVYCKNVYESDNTNYLVETFYNPSIGVGYIFISNLVSSIFKYLLLLPTYLKARPLLDKPLLKQMLVYALPLMFAGFAGIINETLDRVLLKFMLWNDLGEKETMTQLGIYGACYKISIFITLFIQAYRYAAEPFFFAKEKDKDSKETYAFIMKYFVIVCVFMAVGIMLYLDVAMLFIGEDFREGMNVVPILLAANICLGIYYNQSVWYKLSEKTKFGAYIAIFGAIITIALNILLIPHIGYMGSAWATLACYGSMMLVSYFLGQKHYPIPYDLKNIFFYLLLGVVISTAAFAFEWQNQTLKYLVHTLLIAVFAAVIYFKEKPNFKKSI